MNLSNFKIHRVFLFLALQLVLAVRGASFHEEKPLVILIMSYNNSEWYKRNLDSVFSQNYSNWRVVYVDDCSPDGTGDLVEQHIRDCGQEHRCTLVKNKKRMLKMSNFYNAVHTYCNDDDIVLDLDGDDWWNHNNVLKTVNEVYSDPNIWLTYGNNVCYPSGKRGECCDVIPQWVVEKNAYREYKWVTSHQRSFYAWLFKMIKLKDFLYDGRFISVATDMTYIFPMLEMSGGCFKFIRDCLYVYNQATPFNNYKTHTRLQAKMNTYNRKHRERYSSLDVSVAGHFDRFKNCCADLLIFSEKAMDGLHECIDFVRAHVSGIGNITVVNTEKDFKKSVLSIIESSGDYLVLMRDDSTIEEKVDLHKAIWVLEATKGYAFFLKKFDKHQTFSFVYAGDLAYAWQFKHGKGSWRVPNNLNVTLYRKRDVEAVIRDLHFSSLQELEIAIERLNAPDEIGLTFR